MCTRQCKDGMVNGRTNEARTDTRERNGERTYKRGASGYAREKTRARDVWTRMWR